MKHTLLVSVTENSTAQQQCVCGAVFYAYEKQIRKSKQEMKPKITNTTADHEKKKSQLIIPSNEINIILVIGQMNEALSYWIWECVTIVMDATEKVEMFSYLEHITSARRIFNTSNSIYDRPTNKSWMDRKKIIQNILSAKVKIQLPVWMMISWATIN